MKLSGFIFGALLVAAAVWFLSGAPARTLEDPADFARETIQIVSEHAVSTKEGSEEKDLVTEAVSVETAATTLEVETSRKISPPDASQNLPMSDEAYVPSAVKQSWQMFWKPFGTQNSAKGFADSTSKMTGVTIEVKEEVPGKYRVFFPYSSEEERSSRIALIEEKIKMKIGVE